MCQSTEAGARQLLLLLPLLLLLLLLLLFLAVPCLPYLRLGSCLVSTVLVDTSVSIRLSVILTDLGKCRLAVRPCIGFDID